MMGLSVSQMKLGSEEDPNPNYELASILSNNDPRTPGISWEQNQQKSMNRSNSTYSDQFLNSASAIHS